jgi:hypothetical protein
MITLHGINKGNRFTSTVNRYAGLKSLRLAKKNYVAELEARIAQLESILREADTKNASGPSDVSRNEGTEPPSRLAGASNPRPATPPIAPTQLDPQLDPTSEPGFVPSDDVADSLQLMAELQVQRDTTISTEELDLGMDKYEPLISLEMEHQLLARFWDWQQMHLPFVVQAPFLSAYAIYAAAAHPDEPISLVPSPNRFVLSIPSVASVRLAPELAQFISPLLLDSMFAVAALFHGDPEMSEMFYQRARQRVLEEAAKPFLATLQAVCLMTVWEMGHARTPAAWTLSGMCFL